jgi:hypothetical protein
LPNRSTSSRQWWAAVPNLGPEVARPKRPRRVKDFFTEEGKLRPYPGYVTMDYWFATLVDYHRKAARIALRLEEDDYKIPSGVRWAMRHRMVWNQLASQYPWAVYVKLRNGKVTVIKRSTIGGAIMLHKELVPRWPNATIASVRRMYDIPIELRGKLPPGWKWCPRCLKPRKFKRSYDPYTGEPHTFYGPLKHWSTEKRRWVTEERKLALMLCPMCGLTNRDPVFRRSNQPYHTRKFKRGVIRATRRKRRKKKRGGS